MGGIVSSVFGGGGSSTPSTPDYTGAAQATAQGNLDNIRAQLAANRVNQNTPYGSLSYQQSGTDQYGNPTYTANQTLSGAQQGLLDQSNNLKQGLLSTAQSGLPAIQNLLSNPTIDQSKLPASIINPGQTYIDAENQLLQPTFDRQNQSLNAQLANQGITQGSQAYTNAQRDNADNQNRLSLNAVIQGIQNNQSARTQELGNQVTLQDQPLNVFNALQSGTGVTNPSYVSPSQQGYAAGADLSGAAQAGYNSQLSAYNSKVGQQNSLNSGLFSLGSSALAAPTGTFAGLSSGLGSLGSGIGDWFSGLGSGAAASAGAGDLASALAMFA